MADGLVFYWMSWTLWIIVTFLMKKSQQRTVLGGWILLSIWSSNVYLTIDSFQVSLLFFVLLGGIFFMHIRLSRTVYHLYISFIIMIGFTAILLLEKNTPVWLFLPRIVLVPVTCSLLIVTLTKGLHNRLINGLFGIAWGELIYSLILSSYSLEKVIGDMVFFDNILITVFLIVCLDAIQKGRRKVYSLATSYKQSLKIAK